MTSGRPSGRGPVAPARSIRRRVVLAPLVAGSAAALLAALTTLLVVRGGAPFPVATANHAWLVSHRTTALTAAARAVSITGTGVPAYALAGAGLAATLRLRRRTAALVGILAILAGQAVRILLAWSVDRARPPRFDWATSASGPSFPSGHATNSALVAGLVCIAASYAMGASGRRSGSGRRRRLDGRRRPEPDLPRGALAHRRPGRLAARHDPRVVGRPSRPEARSARPVIPRGRTELTSGGGRAR
jgi:hypothetical protein